MPRRINRPNQDQHRAGKKWQAPAPRQEVFFRQPRHQAQTRPPIAKCPAAPPPSGRLPNRSPASVAARVPPPSTWRHPVRRQTTGPARCATPPARSAPTRQSAHRWAASPISTVQMPIISRLSVNMDLRPMRSPKVPEQDPAHGTRQHAAGERGKRGQACRSRGSNCGKNSLLNTSAAAVPYARKSNASTAVPTTGRHGYSKQIRLFSSRRTFTLRIERLLPCFFPLCVVRLWRRVEFRAYVTVSGRDVARQLLQYDDAKPTIAG